MFLALSKILPLFLYPLGLAAVLVSAGLMLRDHRRRQAGVLLTALAVLYFGGNRWVAFGLARTLEGRYPPLQVVPAVDIIIILGGGTEPAGAPRPMAEVNEAGDRLLYGAWLYQQGAADRLLLSGGGFKRPDIPSEAADMAAILELMGVPRSAVILEETSRNTRENATYSRALLNGETGDQILLVTSATHMPRAIRTFARAGLAVIPAPVDYRASEAEWLALRQPDLTVQVMNMLPEARSLEVTTTVIKEYFGLMVYRLRGWA